MGSVATRRTASKATANGVPPAPQQARRPKGFAFRDRDLFARLHHGAWDAIQCQLTGWEGLVERGDWRELADCLTNALGVVEGLAAIEQQAEAAEAATEGGAS